jgi:hypothetical protein
MACGESQVGEKLGHVERQYLLDRFQFDDDAVFDETIDSVATFKLSVAIDDWQPDLVLEMQTREAKFVFEAGMVSAFKKAGPKGGVDSDRCADDSVGDVLMHHEKFVSASSASSAVESFRQQALVQRRCP